MRSWYEQEVDTHTPCMHPGDLLPESSEFTDAQVFPTTYPSKISIHSYVYTLTDLNERWPPEHMHTVCMYGLQGNVIYIYIAICTCHVYRLHERSHLQLNNSLDKTILTS